MKSKSKPWLCRSSVWAGALTLLGGILLSACNRDTEGGASPTPSPSPAPTEVTPVVPPTEVAPVVAPAATAKPTTNGFSMNLLRALGEPSKNIAFSPASVRLAFGMVYAGAAGKTATEIDSVFEYGGDATAVGEQSGKQLAAWKETSKTDGLTLVVQNSLYGQQGLAFEADFLKILSDSYLSPLQKVDFAKDPQGSRKKINAQVEKTTNGKIKDLLSADLITPLTQVVLVNAVYFKGAWDKAFDAKATKPGDFMLSADKKVSVPMMSQKNEYHFVETADAQIIELPYKGNQWSFVAIMPTTTGKWSSLDKLEQDISQDTISSWLADAPKSMVSLTMPKFKIESAVRMKDLLIKMGIPTSFDQNAADFTKMAKIPGNNLYISEVVHKAFVEVNEAGTEAAAATGVVMTKRGMPLANKALTLDRPFLFVMRDNASGQLLFVGRVVNPT